MSAEFPKDLAKTALYLRKSRADFEAEARGEGETLSKHKRALLEVANRNRLNVINVREEIVSGEHISDRPEMKRLLQEVEAGEYDAVLCMDLDRLGRGDMIDQGTILAAFKASSTLIITPRKVYDLEDDLDEEWSEFEAFMARRELKIITKRLQRGRSMAVKEGKFVGANLPFGYDRGQDNILIPNKDAEIVRLVFGWYVNGENGEPIGSTRIANRLNEMGIKSPLRSIAWEPSTIRAILKNEVYIGRIQWKKHLQNKEGSARSREQYIDVLGKHDPLISESLFAAAQSTMNNRRIVPTKHNPRNPLAGLIICGVCGHRMIMQPVTQKNNRKVKMCKCIYSGCTNKSAAFHFVEDRVLATLEAELANIEINQEQIAAEINADNEPAIPASILGDLINNLNNLQKQRATLQDLLEQNVYDVATYLERNRLLNEKIEQGKKTLAQANAEIVAAEERIRTRHQIIPAIRNVIDGYRATDDVVKKNNLLKTIIKKAIFKKEKSAKLDNFTLDVHLLL